ncbi:MAG: dTDP-4-dehydrorhamnose reductase [Solirubrobacteraceae bacterium]
MRILITGAGGMLGSDVRQVAEAAGHETLAITRAQLDIADEDAVARAITAALPDAVINCAAWTDVDGAESHEAEALAINGAGAGSVAGAAAAAGAWMVHVSSDYVFDGTKTSAYVESDETAPVSAYGRTKLEGEIEVAAAVPDHHTIVRSSWLFGTAGNCFPKTILRLAAERDELRVVSDQVGCPTFTAHLAAALVALAEDPQPGVLHVAGAESCSWYDFAAAIVAAAGVQCAIHPCTTEEFPRPARRPAFSVLESERGGPLLPVWRDGLTQYLSDLEEVAK